MTDRLDLLTPIEVAAALRHLPGMVFLDSSGNHPSSGVRPVSWIAARPLAIHRGSIHSRVAQATLRAAIEDAPHPAPQGGGLIGWVDYEGQFVFGEYPEALCFHHDTGTWSEIGRLSECLAVPVDDSATIGPFTENCGHAEFLENVRRIIEWIAAGDIYQVNLSQSFEATVTGGSLFGLYRELRLASPAPMAAWLSLEGREVLSSSPETFLTINGGQIETRPIKGTRPRFADPAEDHRSAQELQSSAKEAAELVMITDLLRNDLGKVCRFGTVAVAEMLRLETLAQVHHLVSTVTGTLLPEIDAVAALASCFPGGSITGAPKIRAMEIIRELENRPRGIYCGAIGRLGFDGSATFNIAIRTMVRNGEQLIYQTGAGIVADSDPQLEYEETLHKATGIRLAIERWQKNL